MIRYVVAAALTLHGLIHTFGFIRAFRLAQLPITSVAFAWFSPVWTKPLGVLWLLAGAGFLISAACLLGQRQSWWIPGALALVVSQFLVVLAWRDAHAGTWVNVLLLLPLAVGAAHAKFEHDTRRGIAALGADLPAGAGSPIRSDELDRLPEPVKRWLGTAGVVGRSRPRSVWLRQSARMRTSPDSAWMPCEAEQSFRIDRPGFVWSVRTSMLGGALPIDGRDSYLGGHGRMLIKPLSFLKVVDAADSHVDQGTLLRFLGELVWFPSGALESYIQWSAVDANRARATMTYAQTTASATFEFDGDGRVTQVSADRYMSTESGAELKPWIIPFREWKALDGIIIPVEGEVIWQLESGRFPYYDFTVDALHYDPSA
jgi:hypothetical protein